MDAGGRAVGDRLVRPHDVVADIGGDRGALRRQFLHRRLQVGLALERRRVAVAVQLSSQLHQLLLGPGPSLAATSGVHTGSDVVKVLAVGSDVAMMTSAILQFGPMHVSSVEAELRSWLADHDYTSVTELRGSVSQATSIDASAFERTNYVRTLHSWT